MASTFQNTAVVRDEANAIMAGQEVIWTSLKPSVATVSNTGLITAITSGTAVIVAQAGGVAAACTVTVTPA
jgi:uncharacterized protein YjdB